MGLASWTLDTVDRLILFSEIRNRQNPARADLWTEWSKYLYVGIYLYVYIIM